MCWPGSRPASAASTRRWLSALAPAPRPTAIWMYQGGSYLLCRVSGGGAPESAAGGVEAAGEHKDIRAIAGGADHGRRAQPGGGPRVPDRPRPAGRHRGHRRPGVLASCRAPAGRRPLGPGRPRQHQRQLRGRPPGGPDRDRRAAPGPAGRSRGRAAARLHAARLRGRGAAHRPDPGQRHRGPPLQRLPPPRRAAHDGGRIPHRGPGQPQRHLRQRAAGHRGGAGRGGHGWLR